MTEMEYQAKRWAKIVSSEKEDAASLEKEEQDLNKESEFQDSLSEVDEDTYVEMCFKEYEDELERTRRSDCKND